MSLNFENPLVGLKLDSELVTSVSQDPEMVRQLAKLAFKTIVSVNHPDRGGDGSMIESATEANTEIINANDEDLMDIVEEYFDLQEESSDSNKDSGSKAYFLESQRRKEEDQALLEIARTAPVPKYKNAFIELGKSSLYCDQFAINSNGVDDARFVMVDSDLKGHYMEVDLPRTDADYVMAVETDRGMIIDKNTVEVSATEFDRNDAYVDAADNRRDDGEEIVVNFKSAEKYNVPNDAKILGVIEREYIEAQEAIVKKKEFLDSEEEVIAIGTSEDAPREIINWLDVASVSWLKHVKAVETVENMANKYIVIASQEYPKIALYGLCRQIV